MNIFVTGATGVLGRPVVCQLVSAGHHVRALARSQSNAEVLHKLGAEPVQASLFEIESMKAATADSETILHLATKLPPTAQMRLDTAWAENDRIRREGTHNLVEAGLASKVKRFVYPSICMIYPDSADQWIDATNVTPCAITYLNSTIDAENEVNRFSSTGGNGIVLRMGTFYGPESPQSQEILAYARKGIAVVFGRKDAYHPSIWIDDAARAVVTATTSTLSGIYDIVDDEPLTTDEMTTAIAQALNRRQLWRLPMFLTKLFTGQKLTQIMSRSQRVSNRRYKEATGWKPEVISARMGWARIASTKP